MGDGFEKPVGQEYAGPSGIGRDSTWLTSEDLVEGREVEVTIEKVLKYPKVKFEGGREKTDYLGLQFAGKERVLGLNSTNRKALVAMFGNIVAAWKGRKVTLYVGQTKSPQAPKGQTVPCVRIKNLGRQPDPPAAATQAKQSKATSGSVAGASAPAAEGSGAPPSSAPAPDARLKPYGGTDAERWQAFLADTVAEARRTFQDEREWIREEPAGSGSWILADREIGEPRELYDAAEEKLVVDRAELDTIEAAIRQAAGILV